jgi:nucleotide-binding universal stress UspA family protein
MQPILGKPKMRTLVHNAFMPLASSSLEVLGAAAAIPSLEQSAANHHAHGVLRLNRLLVPVDLSITSLNTLRCAVRLSEQFGGSISAMHVVEPATFSNGLRELPLVPSDEECARSAAKRLGRWCRHTMGPGLRREIIVRMGNPESEITQAAQWLNADLIVMSTHGYTGLNHLLLHSVTERVVRDAPCLTLAIHESLLMQTGHDHRGMASLTWNNILVPVDFTPCSLHALRWAGSIAGQTNAKLTLLHAVKLPAEVKVRTAGRNDDLIDLSRPREEMHRLIEHQLAVWSKHEIPDGAVVENCVYVGAAAAEIIARTAQRLGCDLIVMGNHHYSWWKHLGRADVSERVVRTARCPVLSVPERVTHCRMAAAD